MRKSEFNHIINLNFYDYETHYFLNLQQLYQFLLLRLFHDKFVSDVSNQNAEVETLIRELQNLNEETLAEYGKTIDFTTRATIPVNKDTPELEQAKMKWWKRLLSVIAADAVGAACGNHFAGPAGGVIVGAGASFLMYWATGCGSAINNQGIGNDFSQDDLSAYTIVMDSIFII